MLVIFYKKFDKKMCECFKTAISRKCAQTKEKLEIKRSLYVIFYLRFHTFPEKIID